MAKKDYDKVFKFNLINRAKEYNAICFDSAGIITNFEVKNGMERVYYINENLHTLIIGSSGSGKSRSILIPSITMLRIGTERTYLLVTLKVSYIYIRHRN